VGGVFRKGEAHIKRKEILCRRGGSEGGIKEKRGEPPEGKKGRYLQFWPTSKRRE